MQNLMIVIASLFLTVNGYLCYESISTLKSVEDHTNRLNTEYQMVVTDSTITVYDASRIVGTVKLEGELNDLIASDNL